VNGIPATTALRTLRDLGRPDRLVREALARDAALLAAGWRVLRVTYRRLRREPTSVAAQLAAILAQAASASNSSEYGWSVASATGA
jgi:hypothetical protein